MDDQTIIEGLAYISLCVGERLSEERIAVYVDALRDLKNPDYFAKTVQMLRERCEHMPKIPMIRETYREVRASESRHSGELTSYTTPTPTERAALAAEMRAYISEKWGSGASDAGPTFSEPESHGRCTDCATKGDLWSVGPNMFCKSCTLSRRKVSAKVDFDGLLRDMPGEGSTGWPVGNWRRKNCIEQPYTAAELNYEAPEPPGGREPQSARPHRPMSGRD